MDPWDFEETVPLAPSDPGQDAEEATSRLVSDYDPETDDYGYYQDDAADEVDQLFDGAEEGPSHAGRNALIIVLAVVLVAALAIVGYSWGRTHFRPGGVADYPGPGISSVQVSIPMGASSQTVASVLFSKDIIASQAAFVNAANSDTLSWGNVQAGTYSLKTQMSAEQALQALADPANRVRNQFTIIEGWQSSQVFDAINKATGVSVDDLKAAAAAPMSIGLPAWAGSADPNDPLEGYLFPDTYEYGDKPTATSVLKPLGTKFNQVVTSLQFATKVDDQGLTPNEAVVLASIVQMEATPKDMPDVAQVFLNRLAINMPLQSDATVAYANGLSGTVFTTDAQRALDSPYNTYKYNGLPPGPICNPGQDALSAVVNPSGNDYLYFTLVDMNGTVAYAKTAEEHQRNVAQLQAWCNASPENKAKCK